MELFVSDVTRLMTMNKERGATYHARPYPIPKIYETTLKIEQDRLSKLGVIKQFNWSQCGSSTLIIPKKDKPVRFERTQ
jgi:hypothetical protein